MADEGEQYGPQGCLDHDLMNFRYQLIKSLSVRMDPDIVSVPVENYFEKTESERNNMDQTSCQRHRAFLAYRDFQRFVKPSPCDVTKGFESVRDQAQTKRSGCDFGRILRVLSKYSKLASKASIELALYTFNNKEL